MKKIILSLLSLLAVQSFGQEVVRSYPIQATMIKPEMKDSEYMVEKPFDLKTMYCIGEDYAMKPANYYNKDDVYTGNIDGFSAKDFLHLSMFGDVVAKMILTDSVFIGENSSWPVVMGVEVAKEGIIQYSDRFNVAPENKERTLNVTAGISAGTSIANLAIAAGATNPLGALVGLVGGVVVYKQAKKHYELRKKYADKIKVVMYVDHPYDSNKVVACD